ncbi:MAG: Hpt domain-containing protein [Phycisphaerales bacterium]|nr:Hpt domain-containing protein [Phycisphaerales bacterium]
MPETLISQLVEEDPSMKDLVEDFVAGLPDTIANLRSAAEALNWEELRMLAHRLKGSGGSYGYPQISEVAALMEQHFRKQTVDDFADCARQLDELVAAARAGLSCEA